MVVYDDDSARSADNLCISLTFLRKLSRNRMSGERRREQIVKTRQQNKKEKKLQFSLSCFMTLC